MVASIVEQALYGPPTLVAQGRHFLMLARRKIRKQCEQEFTCTNQEAKDLVKTHSHHPLFLEVRKKEAATLFTVVLFKGKHSRFRRKTQIKKIAAFVLS